MQGLKHFGIIRILGFLENNPLHIWLPMMCSIFLLRLCGVSVSYKTNEFFEMCNKGLGIRMFMRSNEYSKFKIHICNVSFFFRCLFFSSLKQNKEKWPSAMHTSCSCQQNAFLMGFMLYFEKTVVHLCQ